MPTPIESLPDLQSPYPVTLGDVEAYRRDGHVLLRGVARAEEVASYRPLILDAVLRLNQESRPLAERDTYGKAFLQTTNLWEFDEAVARFSLAKRFGQIAADLMGVDAVRIYHDQALFKEPGGGPTPWHQDQYYWPIDTPNTITMWMPLVPAGPEMGTMRFASGSHRQGYLEALRISDESDAFFEEFVRERGYPIAPSERYDLGDASFHGGWVLHAAGPNTTQTAREAMTVIYLADGARIVEPEHDNRRNDLGRWFPGQEPGDLCGSRINPIVFQRGS